MARNKKKRRGDEPQVDGFSPAGKKVISLGLAALALGFIVLFFADPFGRNWAALSSSFLIVSGYVLVGVGAILPEPAAAPVPDLPPPSGE